jgi:predicted aldo/keto reductase-like oxidoreductase
MTSKREVSRRQILALGGAASAAALVGPVLSPATAWAEDAASAPKVPRRTFGKTGQSIPILLLGGSPGFDRRFDPRIAEALRYGVDYIDAARVYAGGKCEPHMANTLHKLNARKKTWITTKSTARDADGFAADVEVSLKKIRTDYIDLYYLHSIKETSPLADQKLVEMAARLKGEGKIRYFGFTCHGGDIPALLHEAARRPFIDSVMFRYNFRQYGNKALNDAIDAAYEADVGLIAMKTQASEAMLREAATEYGNKGKWNKYQAALKSVWADTRIAAVVSRMDNLRKLRENIAAALDKEKLGLVEQEELRHYAAATRAYACDGCDHICGAAVNAPVRIGATMRYLMYHDIYGDPETARDLFRKLPSEAQRLANVDFAPANRACPHGVDVSSHMRRALQVLA